MGRPGLTNHRKFIRLAYLLQSQAIAMGSLELIWLRAYESGDDFIGDAVAVELAAGWQGEPGKLVDALLSAGGKGHAGFIELVEGADDQYRVHDLWHHAPDYVAKRREREVERIKKGVTLSDVRRSAARSRWDKQKDASGMQADASCSQNDANGVTPSPSPSPSPSPQKPDRSSAVADGVVPATPVNGKHRPHANGDTVGFRRFWSTWPEHPRKRRRKQCVSRWKADNLEPKTDPIVRHVEASIRSVDWRKNDRAYIPEPLTYLGGQYYEAPLPPADPAYGADDEGPTPEQVEAVAKEIYGEGEAA